jgi:2-polyprenyl-6-hydroxyphenyl methylase/3-demethylubiquinone-9 3-methyltransferase
VLDNDLYNRVADTWWKDGAFLNFLKAGVNPARFGYMRGKLVDELKMDPKSLQVLDVGCGGGLLAEEFDRLGCHVTGVDPSAGSLKAARAHAEAGGPDISYQHGTGEALPVPDASFDVAYCCDVLEHVDSVDATLREIARSLKPGGVFFYDTINRTRRSRMLPYTANIPRTLAVQRVWSGSPPGGPDHPAHRLLSGLPHGVHDGPLL